MTKETAAHFDLIKMQNRKMLRNLLRTESPLSIAKAAEKTGLSYPTVSGLLKELLLEGQVLISEQQNIAGGRPGICYELNAAYQYGLTLFFDDMLLQGKVYDATGTTVRDYLWKGFTREISAGDIAEYVGEVKQAYPALTAVAIGVPGAVKEKIIMYLPKFPALVGDGLANALHEKCGVDVFMENDINAIAFAEVGEWENFAHIVYVEEDHCIGVGIVLDGEIVRGSQGFAGELEYLCEDLQDEEKTFLTGITALTCVLNLSLILVSGSFCTEENVRRLREKLACKLPVDRIPELHIVDSTGELYDRGLFRKILLAWSQQI